MLQIDGLTFDAWGRRFLDKASVALPTGAKIGLVGRNGVGKSTLFRLIKGELTPGEGSLNLPRGIRIGAVDQEHPATPVGLIDTILAADEERHELTRRLETADPETMAEIWERLIAIDAETAPARAAEILYGLGFASGDFERPMAEFSGGWRMRVALAAALFSEPDLLLLDEPTNYLDLEGAIWLEARLKRYPRTVLMISHDRDLLNNAAGHILHMADARLELYTGNYDSFERQRAEKARLLAATAAKQETERAHLQSFVDRFRAKASKATQAQSRLKRLEKLQPVAVTVEARVAPFTLPSPSRLLAPPLLRLEGAAVGYDERPILSRMDLRLDPEDRIGLLGVNGAGKSTFAKLIAGDLPLMAGELARDPRMKVGWFHQHQIEALDPAETPLDIIRRAMPDATEPQRRSKLAQFGFSFDKQETKSGSLSGGERARLLLNLVAMAAPHLIILDEPTNHLDIDSRRALLDALNDYRGAVILITHDRSLMELVADRLWLAADGAVRPYDGDMDDYARLVVERARAAARKPVAAPDTAPPPPPPVRARPVPRLTIDKLRREAEAAEAVLTSRLAERDRLDRALATPDLYVRDPAGAADLARRREAAQAAVEAAESAWISAAEAHEAALA